MPVMFHAQSMPGPVANDATLPPGATHINIGETLRAAREGRARSLEACAHALHMRTSDLRAIEANAFEVLPGGGITIAWLRRYARLVGLNPELLTATYRAQHLTEACSFRSDLTTVIRRKSRRGRRRTLLSFGFALFILLGLLVIGVSALSAGTLSQLLLPETMIAAPDPHRLPVATVPSGDDVRGPLTSGPIHAEYDTRQP